MHLQVGEDNLVGFFYFLSITDLERKEEQPAKMFHIVVFGVSKVNSEERFAMHGIKILENMARNRWDILQFSNQY